MRLGVGSRLFVSEYLVSVESGYGEHESGLIYYVSQTEIGLSLIHI